MCRVRRCVCGEGANSYLYSMILLSGLILSCDHLGLTSAKLARARFENIPYYYDLTSNDLPSGITFFFWGGERGTENPPTPDSHPPATLTTQTCQTPWILKPLPPEFLVLFSRHNFLIFSRIPCHTWASPVTSLQSSSRQ